MTCDERMEATADFLAGDLAPEAAAAFRAHLAECRACADEVTGLLELWGRLGLLGEAEPSPKLRRGFYARLEAYQEGLASRPRLLQRLRPLRTPALLAAGLLAGVGLQRALYKPAPRPEVARLQDELEGLKQRTSLSLISQPEADERLKAITLASQVRKPEPRLLTALLETLDGDPSVNVRLAAVDALYLFAEAPGIRERLSESLGRQDAPMVQVALIDLLVSMREKRAASALRQLANNQKVRPEVRQRAKAAAESLV